MKGSEGNGRKSKNKWEWINKSKWESVRGYIYKKRGEGSKGIEGSEITNRRK